MSVERVVVFDWLPVAGALEAAYKRLGLEKPPEGFPIEHWNIAALVHEHAMASSVRCLRCNAPVRLSFVYRCFDCQATLCANCAPEHFGPKHSERAAAAHRK